ncbi:YbaK/EbsC family protein [Zongyangia hominis]|uniref:YbaK/EbsC family protein n=1 Tax=Zongyangia hominis TaxID=2763677 RepID=A0A926E996_9FIRM|nr:YbaK/EbsC family protein [Zongyangia hominis]MBC8569677.1 YbaK/EbsC family protein [Zongyangia hominis]
MRNEKVDAFLASHGLTVQEFEEGSTATAPMAAAQLGVKTDQIAKSILMRGKDGNHYMAVIPGEQKISSSKIKAVAGCKCSMVGGEDAFAVTGYLPGGVCPFLVENVTIFIDKSLEALGDIYPAAGTSSTAVRMDYDTLVKITGGTPCDVIAK